MDLDDLNLDENEPTETLPDELREAVTKTGKFVMGLRDGSVIHFGSIVPCGPWLQLQDMNDETGGCKGPLRKAGVNEHCSVSVRISDIVWVAQAF